MNWLQYLVEANLYLGIFYLGYVLFLKKETHYVLNRFYLLSICVISFTIPLLQIGILKPAEPEIQNVILLAPVNVHYNNLAAQPAHSVMHFSVQDYILYTYLLGAVILMFILMFKLYQLLKLIRSKPVIAEDRYKLIYINGSNSAFSFFNYLFIGDEVPGVRTIIRHELVHIRQKHSVDIILLEIVKIINWFNPLVYILQHDLKALHEYIADEKTASYETDTLTYSSFLVNNLYGVSGSAITHSFFNYNLLKNRIIMLHQKRSGSLARLKYLIILPICAALLCASTLGFSKTYGWVDLAPKHKSVPLFRPDTSENKISSVSKGTYKNSSTTSKGYKYKETGYLVNNKADFRVIVTEKNGEEKAYFKNSATPAQIKLLKDKYGYVFPSMDIFTKLPPPPPLPPGPQPPVDVKLKAPTKPHKPSALRKLPPPIVITLDTSAPVKLGPVEPAKISKPLPPPPPYKKIQNAFADLGKYMAKHVRYPTAARDNKIMGSVILKFDLDNDHKITNITEVKGLGYRCGEEVVRALKSYTESIDAKIGTYKLAVTYYLDGLDAPNTISAGLTDDPEFIGEIVVTGYLAK